MPRFALLDSNNIVVNIVALERKEDFTTTNLPKQNKDGKFQDNLVETDVHHIVQGSSGIVESDFNTRIGMTYADGKFEYLNQNITKEENSGE